MISEVRAEAEETVDYRLSSLLRTFRRRKKQLNIETAMQRSTYRGRHSDA